MAPVMLAAHVTDISRESDEGMGRKPNYRADRIERERAKATKKAKRLEAKTKKPAEHGGDEAPADEGTNGVSSAADDADHAGGDDRGSRIDPDAD